MLKSIILLDDRDHLLHHHLEDYNHTRLALSQAISRSAIC
jgi:hypothetical protein